MTVAVLTRPRWARPVPAVPDATGYAHQCKRPCPVGSGGVLFLQDRLIPSDMPAGEQKERRSFSDIWGGGMPVR